MNTPNTPHIPNNIVAEAFGGGAVVASAAWAETAGLDIVANPTVQLLAGLAVGSMVIGHALFRSGKATHSIDA